MKKRVIVRKMFDNDLIEVSQIEQLNSQLNIMVPWKIEFFKECIEVGYDCMVLEEISSKNILGFIITSYVAGEAHLLNISVKQNLQGRGLGEILMRTVIATASSKATVIMLEARSSNIPAINLYKKLGFIQTGLRKNYYPVNNVYEDAILMSLELPIGIT